MIALPELQPSTLNPIPFSEFHHSRRESRKIFGSDHGQDPADERSQPIAEALLGVVTSTTWQHGDGSLEHALSLEVWTATLLN